MYSIRFARQLKGLINASLTIGKQSRQSYSKLLSINGQANAFSSQRNTALLYQQRFNVQTESDKDLTNFLSKEIQLEKQQSKAPLKRIPGFEIEEDGANIRLVRKFGDEHITIKLNVNGTVDTDESSLNEESGTGTGDQAPPLPEMKSRPDFSVEIKKTGEKTLVLNCSFFADEDDELAAGETNPEPEEKGDLFQIDNFYLVGKGDKVDADDWADNVYMGDGSLVDGEMYDLLMNYLDERGIGNEFAESLTEFCTTYEHNQYINLLINLKQFIESK